MNQKVKGVIPAYLRRTVVGSIAVWVFPEAINYLADRAPL